MENKDIRVLSDQELKALGYEQVKLHQLTQNNILLIERELEKRASSPTPKQDETADDKNS